MPEPVFSSGALELIRTLALAGSNINRIRSQIHKLDGVWFADIDIIEAGRTFHLEIVPADHATHAGPSVLAFRSTKPQREPDKVALVRPGSFPVPPGGYKITGRRT